MITNIQSELNALLQHYLFDQNSVQTRRNISHDIQVIIQRNLQIDPPIIRIESLSDGYSIVVYVENEHGLISIDEYLEKINENTFSRRHKR